MKKYRLLTLTVIPTMLFATTLNKTPVHYSWRINQDVAINTMTHAFTTHQYQMSANEKQLQNGIRFKTKSSHTAVKLSQKSDNHSLAMSELTLIQPNKSTYTIHKHNALSSQDAKVDISIDGKNLILANALVSQKGMYTLKSRDTLAKGQYTIEVRDKSIAPIGSVKMNKLHYLQGEKFIFSSMLPQSDPFEEREHVSAYLTSPSGRMIPIKVQALSKENYIGEHQLNEEVTEPGIPWHLTVKKQIFSPEKSTTYAVDAAFHYAKPTAKLIKISKYHRDNDTLYVEGIINTQTPSRYALEGTLYAYCRGEKRQTPFLQAQSANWLEKGEQQLTLVFDAKHFSNEDCHGPFRLENIKLIDQGQLKRIDTLKSFTIAKL